MDGIRGEVSNKIRSAIKAKLMELGAYVDNELPDYIMVMVANKRSKQQMEEDLQLFLGDNTVTFTGWLHTVLSKLQQVTISNAEAKNSTEKKRLPVEDLKKDKKKKLKREKDRDKEKSKSDNVADTDKHVELNKEVREMLKEIKTEPLDATDRQIKELEHQIIEQASKSSTTSSAKPSSKNTDNASTVDEEDEDFINIKADAETDMWVEADMEEAQTSSAKVSKQPPKPAPLEAKKPAQEPQRPAESTPITAPVSPIKTTTTPEVAPAEPKPAPRIIKISEAIRQEKEALSSATRRAADPQNDTKIRTVPSPIHFQDDDLGKKEDDAEIFGQHIAYELRQLTQKQRNVAKLKIQQALAKRILLSHVVNDRRSSGSRRKEEVSSFSSRERSGGGRYEERRRRGTRAEHQDLRLQLRNEAQRERARGRERMEDLKRPKENNNNRKLQAVVASVVKFNTRAMEDEEKPDNKVASVVRVKPRPNLPAALQANKSLILKAVAEAQKSVATAPTRPELPASKSPKQPDTRQKKKSPRTAGFVDGGQRIIKSSKVTPQLKKNRPKVRLPSRDTLRNMSVTVPGPRLTPISTRTNTGGAEPADPDKADKVLRWIEGVEGARKSETSAPNSSPLIETNNDVETDVYPSAEEKGETSEETTGDIDLDITMDVSSEMSLGDEAEMYDTNQIPKPDEPWSENSEPQFVVTLNGLDPKMLRSFGAREDLSDDLCAEKIVESLEVDNQEEEQHLSEEDNLQAQEEQEQLLREQLLKQQAIAREQQQLRQEILKKQAAANKLLQPLPNKTSVPATVSISSPPVDSTAHSHLKRPASPTNLANSPPHKVLAKSSNFERCKFWPSCRHGEKCEFYHPTVPCQLFPSCKFADRCLYIHPSCRFNTTCTRVDCPYTHFGPRTTGISSSGSTRPVVSTIKPTACKFFPNCSNQSCPFLHPTVCRFGTYCTKLNCQFLHSDKVPAMKHKWVRL